MELRRLRYFVVLATELHFGRAADQLLIAQPALSQQIKILEREIGTRLFDRTRRRVDLTLAGQVLLEHATDLLARADQAAELTRLAGRGMHGRLRVAFTRSAPGGPAAEIIAAFRARYPDITLDLAVGYTARNVEHLLAGALDAAFVRPPLDDERLAVLTVATDPLVIVLPAQHPLAKRRAIRPDELCQLPVVSWPRANGPGLYDSIQAQVWGPRSPRICREEPDENHMLRAVAANVGIAICVASSLEAINVPGVVKRRFTPPAPAVELGLAHRPDVVSNALERLLILARQHAVASAAPCGHG